MTFQQKNITVSLASFSLILAFFLVRVFQMIQNDTFIATNVFRLWGITIVMAIVTTIIGTILTHIVSAIIEAVRTQEEPDVEDIEDERDQIIDLKGTRVTYMVFSLGSLLAMLTFVFGQPPLVMFTALIFSGLVAQIIGDATRMYIYRRGF
ncbi:MAG: hypothetical protein DWQ07_16445 [Chloroflexi bacterium]|nr:MAG: hypothetical protein DWQ07_16445 [Chloroflexota bacterium]MBL1195343.1 hypothetical protein [Chloroflexota bacterium]NOH12627.1 hypothetical protein [Chloroflexota bacterium]